MNVIIVKEEQENYKHITSPINTVLTLCGWVDVDYKEIKGKPDCPNCLAVVKHCRSLKLPKV